MILYGWMGEKKDDAFSSTQAEVKCKRCGQTKFVPFDHRYGGMERPPKGIEQLSSVRCVSCPTGADWTSYTGRQRGMEEKN